MSAERLKTLWDRLLKKQSWEDIVSQAALLKKARNFGDSDAYRYDSPEGGSFFLKSYHKRPYFIRRTLGNWCLKNEYKTLQFIANEHLIPVPAPVDMPAADVIVCEFILHGETLKSSRKYRMEDKPSVKFFRSLIDAVRIMHEHGVAHGDIRRANIMVMDDATPLLMDFATAVHCTSDSWFGKRWLFSMMAHSDDFSIAKIVRSFYASELENDLKQLHVSQPWYLKIGRFLRQKVYRKLMHRH